MKTGEWIAFGMLVGMVVCHSAIWFRIWREHRMAVATAQLAGNNTYALKCPDCGDYYVQKVFGGYQCTKGHVWEHPDINAVCCQKKDEVIRGLAERCAGQSELLSKRAEKAEDDNVVFDTGSKRSSSEGRGRYDLVPAEAIRRYAMRLQEGAEKYGNRNWEKGQPFSRVVESMLRHAFQYQDGDRSEDHLAAVLFNAGALCFFEREVKAGRLPAELDDMPKREDKPCTT